MLMLGLIPTMMTAGVVREKEMGSITNLYVTPVTGLEFLLGKQLPYAALAFASFTSLLLLGWALFQVPVKGSLAALMVGAALYATATTGFGLLLSTFVDPGRGHLRGRHPYHALRHSVLRVFDTCRVPVGEC